MGMFAKTQSPRLKSLFCVQVTSSSALDVTVMSKRPIDGFGVVAHITTSAGLRRNTGAF